MVTRKRRSNPARKRRRRARKSILFTTRRNPVRRKRRVRRTRRNAWYNDAVGHAKAARKGWRRRKRRPAAKGRRRKNPVYRARRRRRTYRRNPVRGIIARTFSQQWLMQSVTISGGIVAGMLGMPLVYGVLPVDMKTPQTRKFLGLVHVLLGSLVVGFVKNKQGRTLGAVIAGTGVYDLIAENTKTTLGLPSLPTENVMISGLLPAGGDSTPPEEQSASYMRNYGMNASYMVPRRPVSSPAIGTVAASYEAPGSSTVGLSGDNPYAGIF